MNDEELIKTYGTALFMLALIDEWDKLERIGIVAKIYNTITKKHNVFHEQILLLKKGKRKKVSKKCSLFLKASSYAVGAWEKTIQEAKGLQICSNTTVYNLFRLNAEHFTRVYGLTDDDFRKFNKSQQHNSVFNSCRTGRLLLDSLKEVIRSKAEVTDIY